MSFWNWAGEHWFDLLQSAGIIGGLLFTGIALRHETKGRRIANLFTITTNHREIWRDLYHRPELARVLKSSIDLVRKPISREEEVFAIAVILHIQSVYQAIQNDLFVNMSGFPRDIRWILSHPIPAAVWEKVKSLQDREFVQFVEACRIELMSNKVDKRKE